MLVDNTLTRPADAQNPWPWRRLKHPDDVIRLLSQNHREASKAFEELNSKNARQRRMTDGPSESLYFVNTKLEPMELPKVNSIAQFKMPPMPIGTQDLELSNQTERRYRLENLRKSLTSAELVEFDKLISTTPTSLREKHFHHHVSAYVDSTFIKTQDPSLELRTAKENLKDSLALNYPIMATVQEKRSPYLKLGTDGIWTELFVASYKTANNDYLTEAALTKKGIDTNRQRFHFMKNLGIDISKMQSPSSAIDLSNRYPEPAKQILIDPVTGQARVSPMCLGMAWASDMSSLLPDNIKQTDQISGPYTYAMIQTAMRSDASGKTLTKETLPKLDLDTIEDFLPMTTPTFQEFEQPSSVQIMIGETRLNVGEALKNNPIMLRSKAPTLRPITESDLHQGQYKVSNYVTLKAKEIYTEKQQDPYGAGYSQPRPKTEHITYDYVATLLSNGIGPIAYIDTDERQAIENWYTIPASSSQTGHVLNIVGHGNDAIDPITLQTTEYFIVRDSFVPHTMHYQVPARELLPHLLELEKVTAIESTN